MNEYRKRGISNRLYYTASQRKEILTYATTWMNVEDFMLSEIQQS